MPVPTEITVRCSVCRTIKGELNRWFLFGMNGAGNFLFTRYFEDGIESYDGALCGIECLLKKVQEHAQALMAAHPAGRKK